MISVYAAAAIITSIVVANATQTITTPNAVKITYSLAAGANSAAITPATNTSVLVMGCCTTTPFQGSGHVSLLHSPATAMAWTGVESHGGVPTTFASGGTSSPPAHIMFIDAGHVVEIQVNPTVDTIRIHNGHPSLTLAGSVTLIW
ncbi:MAG TPA: hypothetical protein VGI41_00415 [Candidatus Udaeobacter sp.]